MKPISFEDVCKTKKSGNKMCSIIKDASQWSKYNGYGILPGVEKAEYMVKTERMVGSQFSVINSDGSNHIEEVMEWVEGERVVLKMHQFVFPLNKLATHFTEVFTFTPSDSFTIVSRKFEMFPKSALSRPILWVISLLLRKAIERHSLEMAVNR